MTGAPKVRAMEIIDELEPIKGPYAGTVGIFQLFREYGYMYHDKNAYNNKDGKVYVQAGAGLWQIQYLRGIHRNCKQGNGDDEGSGDGGEGLG